MSLYNFFPIVSSIQSHSPFCRAFLSTCCSLSFLLLCAPTPAGCVISCKCTKSRLLTRLGLTFNIVLRISSPFACLTVLLYNRCSNKSTYSSTFPLGRSNVPLGDVSRRADLRRTSCSSNRLPKAHLQPLQLTHHLYYSLEKFGNLPHAPF